VDKTPVDKNSNHNPLPYSPEHESKQTIIKPPENNLWQKVAPPKEVKNDLY